MPRTNWYADHPTACTCRPCEERRHVRESRGGRKIGRNERCPCGSGKKYKRCHGL